MKDCVRVWNVKKRINRSFALIALLAIGLTTVLITVVYYNLFRSQVTSDLKDYTMLVREVLFSDGEMAEEYQEASQRQLPAIGEGLSDRQIRLSLISAAGEVLYDNEVEGGDLENHQDRPEVQAALAEGEGQSMRTSRTLARNTFYYAVRLESGSVLRVAKDAGSIVSVFSSVFPTILWILSVLILLSLGMAHMLTRRLIEPIENLAKNMDADDNSAVYEELAPFIGMIRQQHQDIVRNAQMRQEFTANVSHELKTPLTSISGYAELIESGMADREDVVRFAGGIRNSADRLLSLINDIIRLSELDGDGAEDIFETLDLYGMAGDCVSMLQMNAAKNGVTLSLAGESGKIWANRQMMEELLYNLCDNAIRYNNADGSVEVCIKKEQQGREKRIVLSVADTGIGIPKEHQDRIFERFYRVDKSRSKSTGGTGLGLAIVKHIVAKHGAEIELESEAGKGTTISVAFREA